MKKGKSKSESQSKGGASCMDARASRETGGMSGKHVTQKKGWKDRKFVANSTQGV